HPQWPESALSVDTRSDRQRHPRERAIPDSIPVTPDLGYIIGQYAGDGSSTVHFGERGTTAVVEVAYHEDEEVYWTEFIDSWSRVFGYAPRLMRRSELHPVRARRVMVNGRQAVDVIRKLAGHGAATKRFAPEVMHWPVEALKALLVGYLRADGH